jgi:ribosome-binding protein aMBF1 (putative translation factor)
MQVTKGDSDFIRTIPCRICGKPYTDLIDPRVNPEKGGYIVCARCSMRLADSVTHQKERGEIDFNELVNAIQSKKLSKFRSRYGFTQSELARRIGVTPRHLRRIEDSTYIPNSKALRKMEVKLKNVLSA